VAELVRARRFTREAEWETREQINVKSEKSIRPRSAGLKPGTG
jgi:hypothetical protein